MSSAKTDRSTKIYVDLGGGVIQSSEISMGQRKTKGTKRCQNTRRNYCSLVLRNFNQSKDICILLSMLKIVIERYIFWKQANNERSLISPGVSAPFVLRWPILAMHISEPCCLNNIIAFQ